MRLRVAIVYNEPIVRRYDSIGEETTTIGLREDVTSIHEALDELGHFATDVLLLPPFAQAADVLRNLDADVIFNLFEGFADRPETESTMAGILTDLGLPYTGCPSHALALSLDKARAKATIEELGIATPRHQLLSLETLPAFDLQFPCIVKPRREDASQGLTEDSVVFGHDSLREQVAWVSRHFGGMVLVEELLDGREFNATILAEGKEVVLPIAEIVYSLPVSMPKILTYAAKWEPDSVYFQQTNSVCPAQISSREEAKLVKTAVKVFKSMVGSGYARVDMRLDGRGAVNVLEVNPNPDISPTAGAARQAAAASMTYCQFVDRLLKLAFLRNSHDS